MHTFLKVEMIRELKSHVLIQVITKGRTLLVRTVTQKWIGTRLSSCFPKQYYGFIPVAALHSPALQVKRLLAPALTINPDWLLPVICPGMVRYHNAGQ